MRPLVVWSLAVGAALLWPAPPAGAAGKPPGWRNKVEPRLLEAAQAAPDARADFLLLLAKQADLAPAAALPTKEARGAWVHQALVAEAAATQGPLLERLRARGVACDSFWIANMVRVRGGLDVLREMAARADVARVCGNPEIALDLPVSAAGVAPPRTSAVEWNVTAVRAPEVWSRGCTGQGVVVAGQDTGYDWTHAALRGRYRGWDGANADHNYNWHDAIHSGGGGCGPDSLEPCDDTGHGTHTMGILVGDDGAGNQVGVAPGALWIGCRNMNGGWGSPATYAECFQWLVAPTDLNGLNADPAKAPDIVNNSWSCPSFEGCTDPEVLRAVVENARAAGILVVCSAGNSGSACSTIASPPAIYAASLTVGSTDAGGGIASYSSRGPVTADGSGRLKPDVCAPGTSVRSCAPGGGYVHKTGTSMAGPHVAGVAALVLSAHPGLRGHVEALERLLERTAGPRTTTQNCGVPGSAVPNNTYGWGLVDAVAAVGLDDEDGDGMPNWWETVFGLDRTNAADGRAEADMDGDGMSNAREYAANTDPTNAAARLRILSTTPLSGRRVILSWDSRQNGLDTPRGYDVYRSDSLLGGMAAGDRIATNLPSGGPETVLTNDLPATGSGPVFYAVAVAGHSNAVFSAAVRLDR